MVNLIFSYIFVLEYHFPIYSLALAYSIGAIVSAVIMLYYFNKKVELPKIEIGISFLKIFISTIVMGVAVYVPIKLLDQLVFDTTKTINLLMLTGIASFFGIVSYVFFTWLFDIKEAYYIVAVLKKFGNRDKILKQIGEIMDGPKLNM